MARIRKFDLVQTTHTRTIPVRYRGRTGQVVGLKRTGRGFQYLVSFAPRRVTPLQVSGRNLKKIA